MRSYYKTHMIEDEIINVIGLMGTYGAIAAFTYNLGYIVEDVTGTNIQYNPITNDFTPTEKTLQEADDMGILIY